MSNNIYEWCKACSARTSLWEKLRIDQLEGVLLDDARRTLGLEAAIYALNLCLGKSCRATECAQRVRTISDRCVELLGFRVCTRVWLVDEDDGDAVWFDVGAGRGGVRCK